MAGAAPTEYCPPNFEVIGARLNAL